MRQYDPAIARWTSTDPVTHYSASTYNAFDNNPVFFADPSGADSIYNFETGQYVINGTVVSFDEAMAYAQNGGNADGGNNNTPNKDSKSESKKDGDEPIDRTYKGKKQTGPATPLVIEGIFSDFYNIDAYNCHSFAWCNSQGDPADPANAYWVKRGVTKWDNNPLNNMKGYRALKFDDSNQVGDRVIYYAWSSYSGKVEPTHSAIVTKVNEKGNVIEVESKWGTLPRYKHHPRDIPADYGAKAPTFIAPDGKKYESRIYYRKKP